jgi:hypothetical protein
METHQDDDVRTVILLILYKRRRILAYELEVAIG